MQLVTDRTEADVLLGNEKGRYGYTDLNRVEAAVEQLQRLAAQLDIHPGLTTKTDWAPPGSFDSDNWPTEGQMQRYLANLHTLCVLFAADGSLPQSMSGLDWQGANAIEQALQTTYRRATGAVDAIRYSGEIFAGEEHL